MRIDRFIRSLIAGTIALSGAIVPAISTIAAAPVDLTLVPAGQSVHAGDIFEVIIQAQSGSQQVIGIDAYLDFDFTKLAVVDMNSEQSGIQISGGIALPIFLWNAANNTTGRIAYSAGAFSPYPSETFTVATIRFQALAATSLASPVTFSTSFDRPTLVVGDTHAADITGTLTGATFLISSANTPTPSGDSSGGGEGASGKTLKTSGLSADIDLTTSIPQDPLSDDTAGIEEPQTTPADITPVQTSPVVPDSIITATPEGTPSEEQPPINSTQNSLIIPVIVAAVLIGITGLILVLRNRTKTKP